MRTKALLGLAALAAMITTAAAQNVYSVNVVGYVNVSLTAGNLHFVSLPLIPTDANYDISNTVKMDTGDGSQDFSSMIYWEETSNKWADTNPLWLAGAWDTAYNMPNGKGFFVVPAANGTLTFVGEVVQGTAIPYTMPDGLHTAANKVPVSTNWPGSDVGTDFDTIITWNKTAGTWDDAQFLFLAGWDNGGAPGNNIEGPFLNPADAVFYFNGLGAAYNFTRSFTVAP